MPDPIPMTKAAGSPVRLATAMSAASAELDMQDRFAEVGRQDAAAPAADPLARLLEAVAVGDRSAFARLYELTSGRLFAIARSMLGPAAAEDALQEAFLRVWRSADRYDSRRGPAIAWLTTVVRNRALTAAARAQRHAIPVDAGALDDMADTAPDPMELALQSAEARKVKACLQRLGAAERQAVMLAFFEGLSHRALAARLDVPLGTAKSRIRRALARLAPCLAGEGKGDRGGWAEVLAGEYVIGSLQGSARRGFERRRDRDARFCTAADRWERHLSALAEILPPRAAPPGLWHRVAAALPPATAASRPPPRGRPLVHAAAGFGLAVLLMLALRWLGL